MGGMAAQIPIKNDPEANEEALEKVRQDKLREVQAGHDGTWVAHPGLVPVAKEIFDAHMKSRTRLIARCSDVHVTAKDLLAVDRGQDHRGRPEVEHRRRPAISGIVAARQRLRSDL